MSSRRRLIIVIAVSVTALLLTAFSGVATWSKINCWTEEIDIQSGRVRTKTYFLWCRISSTIKESPISECLQSGGYTFALPEWHLVNTFSPGAYHSPHYLFHGAIFQATELREYWSYEPFTPAARQETALKLLKAWQQDGSYAASAMSYMQKLEGLIVARADEQPVKLIDVPDLPKP